MTLPGVESTAPAERSFDVPNHVLIAGLSTTVAAPLIQTAQRRGWFVKVWEPVEDVAHWIRMVPAGGLVVLDISVLSDRYGIERLTSICDLPALPRTVLVAEELSVNALAVREISRAAGLEIQDILIHPLSSEALDLMLGA